MTEPRDMQRERETEATTADRPEGQPEVVQDLDAAGDDADVIRGGACQGFRPTLT